MKLTLANLLTLTRVIIAAFVYPMVQRGQDWLVLAFLFAAALTDVADGWVARATGQVTRLGMVLDPVADKLVIAAALLGGAVSGRLPAWLAWAYVIKELLQLAGGAVFLARLGGAPIQANRYGKAATVLTYAGLFLIWFGFPPGWLLVAGGLLLGLWAVATYLRAGLAGSPPKEK